MSAEVVDLPRRLTAADQADIVEAQAEVRRLAAQLAATRPGRLSAAGLTAADLIATGDAELVQARLGYDKAKGASFPAYARKAVKGAMLDALRIEGRHRRALWLGAERAADALEADASASGPEAWVDQAARCVEAIAAGMGLCLAEADPEALVMTRELHDEVQAAVREEEPASRGLIERHYFRGETLENAGQALGMSRSTVKRRHGAALGRIGARMGRGRKSER